MATIVTRNAVSGPYGTWPSGVVVSGLPSHVANRMIESGDAEMSEDDLEPVMSKRNNLTGGVELNGVIVTMPSTPTVGTTADLAVGTLILSPAS